MRVFRWGQPWDALGDLEREVDRLLQGMNLTVRSVRIGRRFPQLNIYELPDEYLLTAEIPGTLAEDLDLSVNGGTLTLRGQREPPAESRQDSFRRQERFHGPWQRVVTLPERVDEENLKAEYKAGVLKILLKKAEPQTPRQITVEGSEE